MEIKLPYDRLIRIEENDYLFSAVSKMMTTEGNGSFQYPPFEIVNLYAQKYKRSTYNFDMPNQHALFLLTPRRQLVKQLVDGVEMGPITLPGCTKKGACLTDFFNFAAYSTKIQNGHTFVPIVAAGLGNIHVCDSWDDFNKDAPVPSGCDSTWLRGIYGHTATSNMEFSNVPLKIHVGGYQINKHRMHPLENSQYIVSKPEQVEIILVVEVKFCEKSLSGKLGGKK